MNLPDPSSLSAVVAFDTETDGLQSHQSQAFGLSVAWMPRGGRSEPLGAYWDLRELPQALDWLRDVSERPGARLVAHNASFDRKMLAQAGLLLDESVIDDTIIRAVLIDENLASYSLDDLAARYLGERKVEEIYGQLAAMFGGPATRNVQMRNIARAPASMVHDYAVRDAELTLKLWMWQEREIERQKIAQIVNFERGVMPTLLRCEWAGIRVDVEAAIQAQVALSPMIDERQSALEALAGRPVNVNSAPQVRALFGAKKTRAGWVTDSGHALPATGAGEASIGAAVLREMAGDARADAILEIRSLIKTRDTFLGGHVLGSVVGDRVYPTINQTKGEGAGTRTGRLSYNSPALQQLPSRGGPAVKMVKSVFLPEPGHHWVSFDMNSFEVRVFAHFANDPSLNAAYARDEMTDFHQAVADITGLPRSAKYSGQPNAKQLNLSLIFGSGNGSIAAKMGMEWAWKSFTADDGEEVTYRKAGEKAQTVIDMYHERIPGVKAFMTRAKSVVTARGYLKTAMGRRIRMPDARFAYKQHGLLIQATAADISKIAWPIFEQEAQNVGGRILMSVHDSFELSLPPDADPVKLRDRVQHRLRGACSWFRIPLVIDYSGSGVNYYEATAK